jgi:hypothetical protein
MHSSGDPLEAPLPIPVDVLPAASRLAVLKAMFDAIVDGRIRDAAGASGRHRREAEARRPAHTLPQTTGQGAGRGMAPPGRR